MKMLRNVLFSILLCAPMLSVASYWQRAQQSARRSFQGAQQSVREAATRGRESFGTTFMPSENQRGLAQANREVNQAGKEVSRAKQAYEDAQENASVSKSELRRLKDAVSVAQSRYQLAANKQWWFSEEAARDKRKAERAQREAAWTPEQREAGALYSRWRATGPMLASSVPTYSEKQQYDRIRNMRIMELEDLLSHKSQIKEKAEKAQDRYLKASREEVDAYTKYHNTSSDSSWLRWWRKWSLDKAEEKKQEESNAWYRANQAVIAEQKAEKELRTLKDERLNDQQMAFLKDKMARGEQLNDRERETLSYLEKWVSKRAKPAPLPQIPPLVSPYSAERSLQQEPGGKAGEEQARVAKKLRQLEEDFERLYKEVEEDEAKLEALRKKKKLHINEATTLRDLQRRIRVGEERLENMRKTAKRMREKANEPAPTPKTPAVQPAPEAPKMLTRADVEALGEAADAAALEMTEAQTAWKKAGGPNARDVKWHDAMTAAQEKYGAARKAFMDARAETGFYD